MMNDNPIRCFVAFDLSPETKAFISSIIEKNQAHLPQARWVRPDQIHVTLQFFAALLPSQVNQVKSIIQKLFTQVESFPSTLAEIGAFSSWNRARVIWLGFDHQSSTIMKQATQTFNQNCAKQGIAVDLTRPFSPHLTLARLKNPVSIHPQQLFQPKCYTTSIRQVSFYQSTLTPRGAMYSPLITILLKEVK
ncbi:RNA 2',3'-cyclic phosphodiesterase [Atribacter laminatus]|jgi:2'-5' RNA ligase|uniref:RNA 2',3'-cyclic phosphodiesterase n=1 Tax=Atribacter laminatus TaxID=2847778 RepID=A0A7T1F420_ATRLM|nr:RNA 2',3'-cyclic phosphodiesterase [Atribacter laminatus]QPM69270.1 RNA 2',3'-cyclic phosphodiesterase [Atribacter laminatus]